MSSTSGRVLGAYGAPPAPLGRRVAAWLVDGVGTAICAAPVWLANLPVLTASLAAAEDALAAGADTMTPPTTTADPVLLAVGAVLLLAWGGVQWWFHGTRGWTVGKRLLHLRTVDVRTGRPIGLGRAFVRYLVVALSVLACGVGQVVVLLSPLFDRSGRYRGWHDRVGDAVVVDVRGLAASRRVSGWDDPSRRADPAAPATAAPAGPAAPLPPAAP
ncbi:RDD family protein, partial [Cellulomonas triticagri]